MSCRGMAFPSCMPKSRAKASLLLEPYITCVQMWQECLQILATRPPPLIIYQGDVLSKYFVSPFPILPCQNPWAQQMNPVNLAPLLPFPTKLEDHPTQHLVKGSNPSTSRKTADVGQTSQSHRPPIHIGSPQIITHQITNFSRRKHFSIKIVIHSHFLYFFANPSAAGLLGFSSKLGSLPNISAAISTGFFPACWVASISSAYVYTYPSKKYEFVSWDDDIPNIWKNKTCSCSANHQLV